ncbi:MAG: 4-oxalomesaconate tautomerase [Candidatus Pelagibacter sp.]|nr:4-oxalomesaconate tautomerase [Candidatus Pelagibacter sp.]|tara:strand:- start:961 stop:2046 length:1086 start_codon:yes stop_codon:yes gene_type:complete
MSDQIKIPCLFMRGGTSRGPYFLKSDLPNDINQRNKVLLAAMGSPDVRQIDGLGGADPVKSKVAIISKSDEKNVDVNYYFAQVKIDEPIVDTKPSCGNMLVGVGPASIEKGLIKAKNDQTKIVIRDVNTGMKIEEIVQTPGGEVSYDGDLKIDGVPNTGTPVKIRFLESIGAKTKKLFPTGNKVDNINGKDCSLVDAAMPVVFFRAVDFGVTGNETYYELNQNKKLIEEMEQIRIELGKRIGFGDVSKSVIPKVALISRPDKGNIKSRYFMPWSCHNGYAITGSICLLAASKSKDTICSDFYSDYSDKGNFKIEHPTGISNLNFEIEYKNNEIKNLVASTTRHARLIMSGYVHIQKSLLIE